MMRTIEGFLFAVAWASSSLMAASLLLRQERAPEILAALGVVLGVALAFRLRRLPRAGRVVVWVLVLLLPLAKAGKNLRDTVRYHAAWVADLSAAPAAEPAPAPEDRLNLVLITIDTLRRDALSSYGDLARTPNIEALARSGATFWAGYVLSNHTTPSMAGLFASSYPTQFAMSQIAYQVPESRVMPAQHLAEHGWSTAAVITNFKLVMDRLRLTSGFQHHLGMHHKEATIEVDGRSFSPPIFNLPPFRPAHREIPDTTEFVASRATSYLARGPREPFFLWLHLMDPHDPFAPPPGVASGPPSPSLGPFVDFDGDFSGREEDLAERIRLGERYVTAEEKAFIKARYLDEVRYVDEAVGALLETLAKRALLEHTVVVLTADHGEEFWDHGDFSHGQSFRDVLVNVPLIITHPTLANGANLHTPVSHIDLLPTLYELLGVPIPASCQGRSFAALLRGEPFEPRPAFFEQGALNQHQVGLVDGGSKVLFDDLDESLQVVGQDTYRTYAIPEPGRLEQLRALLREHVARNREQAGITFDPAYQREVEKNLKSLGYVR
jgi:arylsulfatase A-like enzyme